MDLGYSARDAELIKLAWLLRYLSRRTFKVFIIYRLALGVLVLALGWGLHR